MSQAHDDDYHVPLVDQRVFGAGIKRKGIAFVSASQTEGSVPPSGLPATSNIADKYLSIVLSKGHSGLQSTPRAPEIEPAAVEPALCAICNQPLLVSGDNLAISTHESSIAHQVCLQHSHPPSHLDREHVGLRYLQGYGWDPDSRKGLGAKQEGIRIPIMPRGKQDTAGLRELDDEDDVNTKSENKQKPITKTQEPVLRLDAGKVRKQEMEAKKRAEKLRGNFYGPDLRQYLGPDE